MTKKKPASTHAPRSSAVSKQRPQAGGKPAPSHTGDIYPLKITLDNVRPPIWRRVQIPDCTLAHLHEIIQRSMGWTGGHLHVFDIAGEQFGLPEQWKGSWDESDVADSRKVKLSKLVAAGVKKFHYEYDMGDGWRHTIAVEKLVAAEPDVVYPRCVGGARACPPEDCGGPWGYGNFLEAIRNPKHESHKEMLEWIGEEFDPEEFDLYEVNPSLTLLG